MGNEVKFKEIKVGEIFNCAGILFMRINSGPFNGVILGNPAHPSDIGNAVHFGDEELVTPKKDLTLNL